ncbi:ribonuclease G [Uliginosibacterium flavum]|uniref:Ribonuclease G n=1 Tax=Uliginosibacterium flavum TaxID=1396831 RepID=A0ABV2THM2_9RHOO
MSEAYLINFTPQETRVALLYNGVVQELHIEREHSRGFVGNIYLGKVVRVLPGMQSAFIDIGLERTAFLHVADIWMDRAAGEVQRPIERLLNEGQSLIVQVLKDPLGTKGARLSTQLSIAGRLVVYLPQDNHIGISQRIENEASRDRLRSRLQSLLPPEEKGGFIVRTQAEQASDEELAADVAYLRKQWSEIEAQRLTGKPPALLYRDLNLAQRVLRDLIGSETEKVVIDSRENHQKMAQFAADYMPRVADLLEHYAGERPLFDLHGVEEEIQKALARRVDLKSGGYLIIDQTEALCTIDVNTGGFVGARTFDDTIFKTNLEAAQAIARQLRLRNLGGIILLDFIDMENEEHRLSVLAELTKALARDHTKVSVGGFTSLGLVEMTRKRTRESLAHVLCQACPTCEGRGEVKTARTVAYEVMREVVREARQFSAKEFRILASPSVVEMFHEEEAQAIANLQDFIGKPISFHAETSYTPEQFDIVLL